MAPDDRVVQSDELGISPNLEGVVTNPSQGNPVSPAIQGGFPQVDMTRLNRAIYDFLTAAASPDDIGEFDNATGGKGYNVNISRGIPRDLDGLMQDMDHSFFTLNNLCYKRKSGSLQLPNPILLGDLSFNFVVPFDAFKRGLSAMVGNHNVDYLLQEYSDRMGVADQTKSVDLLDPKITEYFPGFTRISSLSKKYIIPKNHYLLLLALEPKEREYVAFFFDEASKANIPLLPLPIPASIPMTTTFIQTELMNYSMCKIDIQSITGEKHILGFPQILDIGRSNGIQGMPQYTDKLAGFRELLTKIPTA